MTEAAKRFQEANAKSPVVSGYALGPDGEPVGVRYTLKNGKSFDLTVEDLRAVPVPTWDLPK